MAKKTLGILHLSYLSAFDNGQITKLCNLVLRTPYPPKILVVSGFSNNPLLYPKCSVLIHILQKQLKLTPGKLILLPSMGDKQHLTSFVQGIYRPILRKQYQPYRPDIVTYPELQVISIDVTGSEEKLFLMWDLDIQRATLPNTKPTRVLVTTTPLSQWKTVPHIGFKQWNVESPLFEISSEQTRALRPFRQQIATPQGSCQYLQYLEGSNHIVQEFRVVATPTPARAC